MRYIANLPSSDPYTIANVKLYIFHRGELGPSLEARTSVQYMTQVGRRLGSLIVRGMIELEGLHMRTAKGTPATSQDWQIRKDAGIPWDIPTLSIDLGMPKIKRLGGSGRAMETTYLDILGGQPTAILPITDQPSDIQKSGANALYIGTFLNSIALRLRPDSSCVLLAPDCHARVAIKHALGLSALPSPITTYAAESQLTYADGAWMPNHVAQPLPLTPGDNT